MNTLRVGDPLDKNTDVGAINSAAQLDRIEALVDAGEHEGADAAPSAARCPSAATGSRRRCSPTSRRSTASRVEEIFGPVVSVMTFRTDAEAIAKANNTAYGLAAGVWTDKGARAFAVTADAARRRPSGRTPTTASTRRRAFGGYRESGFGREGGTAGLRPYLRSDEPAANGRRAVAKTHKLYLDGAFVRSESGRHLEATDGDGEHVANVPRASRKDVRDAVRAARKAAGPWAARTAYNRGQILYRFAEALESRADELAGARAAAARRDRARRARRGRDRASTPPCTTPAGPTSCTRCSAR